MATSRRRRKLFLMVCAIGTCMLFLPASQIENTAQPSEQTQACRKQLRQTVSMESLRSITNTTELFSEVKKIMDCPWASNFTEQVILKMDLHTACNASGMLFVTRENTRLGQRLIYEVQRKASKLVDKMLYDMLPPAAPWGTWLKNCAVVGNGGILRNSSCGAKIDSADFVVRLNLPPIVNYSSDVGVKSSLVTLNPSQITQSYQGLCGARKPFVDEAAIHGNADLAITPFGYVVSTEPSFRVFHTMKEMRPQQGVLYFHPDYLLRLDRYWRKRGQTGSRLSSGFMLVSVALELCEKVDIYGFWPYSEDLSQQPLSHHYYDNVLAKKGVHAMPVEFMQLLQMHNQGLLQLHVGKCH